jgi:hypothetical protein
LKRQDHCGDQPDRTGDMAAYPEEQHGDENDQDGNKNQELAIGVEELVEGEEDGNAKKKGA